MSSRTRDAETPGDPVPDVLEAIQPFAFLPQPEWNKLIALLQGRDARWRDLVRDAGRRTRDSGGEARAAACKECGGRGWIPGAEHMGAVGQLGCSSCNGVEVGIVERACQHYCVGCIRPEGCSTTNRANEWRCRGCRGEFAAAPPATREAMCRECGLPKAARVHEPAADPRRWHFFSQRAPVGPDPDAPPATREAALPTKETTK